MAYTAPTAADLKAAFPAFATVADDTIAYWIDRAGRRVDETWTEGDYAMGQMLYAAHEMTLNGLGTGTDAQIAASGLTGIKSLRSGSLSIELAGNANTGGLAGTSYGRRFLELQRLNVGGPLVTATGTVDAMPFGYPPLYREGE